MNSDYKGIIKEALQVNIVTLVVVSVIYLCSPLLFSILSTKQDETWLLSKYVSMRNNRDLEKYCDKVVICDISGVGTRDSIVSILGTLQSYAPAAIGCDIIFPQTSLNDPAADTALANAVASFPAMVMAARPVYDATGNIMHVEESFFESKYKGDVTVYPDGKFNFTSNGLPYISFPCMLAQVAKGDEIDYPKRKFSINYASRFIKAMPIDELRKEDVEGKVVLMGDKNDLRDYIDLKFVLFDRNYNQQGTTVNRVAGILLHAYATAAILEEDWVIIIPGWISLLIGFIAAFSLSILTRYWRLKRWKLAYMKILQYLFILFMIWVCYPIYKNFNLIFNPLYFTIAIAMYDYSYAILDISKTIVGKIGKLIKRC